VLRARLTGADRRALAILAALPILLNAGWAIAGHPVLDGDNLTQNYPLRVYAGEMLAHGRFPLWDAGIWSGVPLLAGWNAGAMFPGTWLFAVLPGVAAYEVCMILAGVASGVGLHLFLRRQACSPLASFLAALCWSEMGFVSGQQCHLGLIEGTAMLPVMLLAVDGIWRTARRPGASLLGTAHWVGLLGLGIGLSVLAGDPRAVSSNAITTAIFLGALVWRSERAGSIRLLLAVAAGGVIGAAVGAVQWLPGLSYLHGSQRAAGGLSFFGFGSLGTGSLPLLVAPYLIGGNGNLGMPQYAGPLNTPEVTFAVGILPVVALFALLPRLTRREGRLGVWYVMFAIGLLLTAGTETPLGNLLSHIPLYGGQRLQNRNSAICDLALCCLLAAFVDLLRPAAGYIWRRSEKLAGSIPVAAMWCLFAAMFAFPRTMQRWMGVAHYMPGLAGGMVAYYAAAGVIGLGALWLVWQPRCSLFRPHRHGGAPAVASWRKLAAGVVLADVLLFLLMASYQPVPTSVLSGTSPQLAAMLAHLPSGERFAIDDPQQLALLYPPFLTDKLGVNDLNLLHDNLASVQGYGSAVPADYEAATGTHDVENLLPASFLGSTYDDLDLALVVAVPDQFGTILAKGATAPVPPGPPLALGSSAADRQPGDLARFNYPPAGPWRLTTPSGTPMSWQLPAPTELSGVTMQFSAKYGHLPTRGDLLATTATGLQRAIPLDFQGQNATATLPPIAVAALSLRGVPLSAVVETVTVTIPPGSAAPLGLRAPVPNLVSVRYALDGALQGLLTAPRWRYAATIGPLVAYRNAGARGQAWLQSSSSPSAPPTSGQVQVSDVQPWQDPVMTVTTAHPAVLVWSEQYDAGWTATVRPVGGGRSRAIAARRLGLLQSVPLPAGRWQVTWHYKSTKAEVGLAASAAGLVVAVVLVLLGSRARRRPRATA
jgi:hypothetical protein